MKFLFVFCFLFSSIALTVEAADYPPQCFTYFKNYKTKPVMDLNHELYTNKSLSGGEIVISRQQGSGHLVARNHCITRNNNSEFRSRIKNWLIFKQLHLANKEDEVFAGSFPVSTQLKLFLYHFALSDAGALWVQQVVNFDLYLIQNQYYKVRVKNNKLQITETDKFLFEVAYSKFYIIQTPLPTHAGGNFIAIQNNFLNKKVFSQSKQKIDHQAILSHEFGHTQFGDPSTRANIYMEAETVRRYENPVRKLNNFLPRKTYFNGHFIQTVPKQKSFLYK